MACPQEHRVFDLTSLAAGLRHTEAERHADFDDSMSEALFRPGTEVCVNVVFRLGRRGENAWSEAWLNESGMPWRDLLVGSRNGLRTRRSEGPQKGISCNPSPDTEGIETRRALGSKEGPVPGTTPGFPVAQ